MKNWKTSALGIASAFFAFVAFSPELFREWPWVLELSKFALVGGLAGLGITARDAQNSGENVR